VKNITIGDSKSAEVRKSTTVLHYLLPQIHELFLLNIIVVVFKTTWFVCSQNSGVGMLFNNI